MGNAEYMGISIHLKQTSNRCRIKTSLRPIPTKWHHPQNPPRASRPRSRTSSSSTLRNLGETVQISQIGGGKIEVIAHTQFSGRYLKYLTKKFLKKQQLRDWLRVVSTSKGVYELRFFNVVADADEEDDE